MKKYITEFTISGPSVVNIDLICKDWNDRFLISTWIGNNGTEYTFIINGKAKNRILYKTKISEYQSLVIANRLSLIHVKSTIFKSAGIFRTESFIKSEIERIKKIKREKELDLNVIEKALFEYERCL